MVLLIEDPVKEISMHVSICNEDDFLNVNEGDRVLITKIGKDYRIYGKGKVVNE